MTSTFSRAVSKLEYTLAVLPRVFDPLPSVTDR